jgi:hypothetical protein
VVINGTLQNQLQNQKNSAFGANTRFLKKPIYKSSKVHRFGFEIFFLPLKVYYSGPS